MSIVVALEQIHVAAPCPVAWDDLEGDGIVRHCGRCNLNVYNFSDMTPDEIVRVVREHEGRRLCAGFYRRADGTMLVRDCPVGLRAMRRTMFWAAGRVAAAIMLLVAGTITIVRPSRATNALRTFEPFASLCERIAPTAPPPPPRRWIAGDIAIAPAVSRNGTGTSGCEGAEQ